MDKIFFNINCIDVIRQETNPIFFRTRRMRKRNKSISHAVPVAAHEIRVNNLQ